LLLLQQSRRALIKLNLISSSARAFPSALNPATGAGGPNRTNEYYTAVTTFKPSWLEVVPLGRASIEHAFVQSEVRTKLLVAYGARVAAFEATNGANSPETALAALATIKSVTYVYAKCPWSLSSVCSQ
jgi:hypothetical protein